VADPIDAAVDQKQRTKGEPVVGERFLDLSCPGPTSAVLGRIAFRFAP
jgi:hypothetical protein